MYSCIITHHTHHQPRQTPQQNEVCVIAPAVFRIRLLLLFFQNEEEHHMHLVHVSCIPSLAKKTCSDVLSVEKCVACRARRMLY